MKPSEELLAMRELLAGKGAWTQETHARDMSGIPTFPDDEKAVCFCVRGAQDRLGLSRIASQFIADAIGAGLWNGWAQWNDDPSRTHLEVIEMIERAAVAAQKAGE